MSIRFLVYSDLHLEFERFDVPEGLDFDVAVVAGDIAAPGGDAVRWAQRHDTFGHRPVVLVPGNHEYYGTERRAELARMRALAARSNVHVLDRDAVVLRGVRFLGATLWTDFDLGEADGSLPRRLAMRHARSTLDDFTGAIREGSRPSPDRPPIRPAPPNPFTPGRARREHRRSRRWLLRRLAEPYDGPTVVVTHHAPHPASLDPAFTGSVLNPCFASALEPACFRGVDLWIHGHLHCSHRYRLADSGTRVVCNPRGIANGRGQPENPSFDPRCVITLADP